MRNIKFRIWHVPSKRFLNAKNFWITADFQSYGGKCVPLNPANEIDLDLPPGVFEFIAADLQPDMGNTFVIQQYTGLKDKNGVEIYEGDIVERRRERGLVDFNDNNYGAVLGWNLLLYQLIPCQKEGWIYADKGNDGELEPIEFYYGCPPDESWEVVGNIFEGVDK